MPFLRAKYIYYLLGVYWLIFPQLSLSQVRKAVPVPELNSVADELMPVLTPNGKRIYFVRSNHPGNMGGQTAGQDIWFSTYHEAAGKWQEPQNIGPPLNNIYNNAISAVSATGDSVWLSNVYLSRNRMAPGLSFATSTATGWSKPQAVTIRNFAPETGFINFFPATDSILLLSMQADTAQLEDIFVCRRVGTREWSEPVNLGSTLNSQGFEIAPFLAPDRKTLYFASNGHGGFGEADIFMSKRLDNSWQRWSEPVNLGKEVNTAGFEGYFVIDADGERAYFTSEGSNKEDTDIYSIRLADISGPGKTDNLALVPEIPNPVVASGTENQAVVPAAIIYFEVNAAELNTASQGVLQRFLTQLQQTPNQAVFLKGHADDTGTESANQQLSGRRAQTVAKFLQAQGVPQHRITWQAYGSTQPTVPNQSAANRAKNRRVEIILGE